MIGQLIELLCRSYYIFGKRSRDGLHADVIEMRAELVLLCTNSGSPTFQ
jgi:hypothetical protein